jgi:hypothetical protein
MAGRLLSQVGGSEELKHRTAYLPACESPFFGSNDSFFYVVVLVIRGPCVDLCRRLCAILLLSRIPRWICEESHIKRPRVNLPPTEHASFGDPISSAALKGVT